VTRKSAQQDIRDIQHFGEEGGVVPVIDVAATSTFLDPKDMERTFMGELQGCYLYSRHSNPTVNIFGKKRKISHYSERQTRKQIDRQTDRQTDIKADRQTKDKRRTMLQALGIPAAHQG
jgi:hypothetical protein